MTPTANLTLLYGHLPLEARFTAARNDGFSAVEILFPYDRSPQWYAARLDEHDLQLALINTPVDPESAPWGRAALPGHDAALLSDLSRAAEICEATGCRAVHVMAGCVAPADSDAAKRVLAHNLERAVADHPYLTLQLEALNSFDVPGYFYSQPSSVLAMLQSLDLPGVGMQFDFYHVVRQGLDLNRELTAALPWVRYVQVAGSPTRNEPDLSRDGLLTAFEQLVQAGYRGPVGYEYRPRGEVSDGLRWAQALHPYLTCLPAGPTLR